MGEQYFNAIRSRTCRDRTRKEFQNVEKSLFVKFLANLFRFSVPVVKEPLDFFFEVFIVGDVER